MPLMNKVPSEGDSDGLDVRVCVPNGGGVGRDLDLRHFLFVLR